MDWNVDPYEGMTAKQIARVEAAIARDNAKHDAERKLVRLYYKTRTGILKTKEFMTWINPNGRDYFGYWYGKQPANRFVLNPKRLDDKLLRKNGYLPAGCRTVKLVAVRKNGADGKLVIKGTLCR